MSSEGDSNAHIVEEEDGKYLHVNSHAKIVEATPVLEWMFTGSSAAAPPAVFSLEVSSRAAV